jgi:hypothetical protein
MGDKSSVSAPRKHLTRSGPSTDCMTTQTLWKTRTADAFLAAGGAAGSMALLQAIQDYLVANTNVTTPIIGGFLGGSALKFFLNRNPPTLEAFWKSTAASVVIGSSVHSFLWTSNGEDGATTIISREYSTYLILFFMILFWKVDVGSIWGAGNSLAVYIAFQSGFWGKNDSANGDIRSLMEDFPIWYILRPYLLGHFYLYICALGLASIRRRVRIYLLRQEFFSNQKRSVRNMNDGYLKDLQTDKLKLRVLFDRMDTSGDGRLDATELKLALRASVGADLSLEDCEYMIGSADTDGDGTLDFNEFCEAVGDILLLR